jgi:hypothetical protein
MVAERGGDTMLLRIGIMRALYPGETRRKRSEEISGRTLRATGRG